MEAATDVVLSYIRPQVSVSMCEAPGAKMLNGVPHVNNCGVLMIKMILGPSTRASRPLA